MLFIEALIPTAKCHCKNNSHRRQKIDLIFAFSSHCPRKQKHDHFIVSHTLRVIENRKIAPQKAYIFSSQWQNSAA